MFGFLKNSNNEESDKINQIQELFLSYINKNKELRKKQEELNENQKKFNKYVLEKINIKEKGNVDFPEFVKRIENKNKEIMNILRFIENENENLRNEIKKLKSKKLEEDKIVSKEETDTLLLDKNYYEKEMDRILSGDFKTRKEEWGKALNKFGNKCPITGSLDVVVGYMIPLSLGHGGTVKENIFPLDRKLALSKGDKNFFTWLLSERLPENKTRSLIDYFSEMNFLTPIEYENFVFWCYENPRDLEEINEGDLNSSIKKWNNLRRRKYYTE